MGDRRDEIIAERRRDAAERFVPATMQQLLTEVGFQSSVQSLGEALSTDHLSLIVEPKRSTADRGAIHPDLDMRALARECEQAGATALSIVTDPELSGGVLADVTDARSACGLPLLARDFIVHPGQLLELRRAGADGVLVPVRAFLGDEDGDEGTHGLQQIMALGHRLGMDVVLSVSTTDELQRALATDVEVLNIDNRSPDGTIDVDRTLDLLAEVPVGTTVISESVAAADEVARLHRAGVDALLLDEGHLDGGLTQAIEVFSDLAL